MADSDIRQYLARNKLDAIILFNKTPFFHRYIPENIEHAMILLTKKEKLLFVSPLFSSVFPGFKVVMWKEFKKDFLDVLKKNKIKTVGLDFQNLYFRQKKFLSRFVKTRDVSKFLEEQRVLKSNDELQKLRVAAKITDEIFSELIKNFSFKSEEEISNFIKIEAIEKGSEISFEPVVASGKNATIAHHKAGPKLNKGFLVLDFGVKYEGYCSDMTRTIYLGKPTNAEIMLYQKMLSIEESCIKLCRPGFSCSKLFMHCNKLLGKDSKYFIHALGHGIGVEVHEGPYLSPKSKDRLVKGSVLAVEPGYYNVKTGIGIRIEDDVLVKDTPEILTKSTKNLICMTKF